MSIMDKLIHKPNMDDRIRDKYAGQWKRCRRFHLNSPNAKICWKCGEPVV